ncbi:WD40 repeat domain-containing protein [Candidatus Poribacteria bacterium]|nr:WD40 repeat domain-containing protein [Candidatus Poribacteria bacterium]
MKNRDSFVPVPHSVEGEDVTTWSLPEGASARFGQGIVETLAFSADGNYLAIGTRIGLWLYEVGTMLPVALWGTERGTWKAAFSPNGKWIAASDWDDNVKVWDIHRGTYLAEITIGDYPSRLAFSPDSRWFATSHSETATIFVWCPETGEMLTKFTGETEKSGRFMPIAFSPDAHLVASTEREDVVSSGESVLLWSLEQEEQIARFTGHTSSIYSLCFSPCGRFLASGGRKDGTVRVWDTVNCQQVREYKAYDAACMIPAYSPEGVLHATAISYDEMFKDNAIITVWNLEDREKLYETEENIGEYAIVDFSRGSRLVYESGDGGINIWHFGKSNTQKSGYQPISFPNTVAFSSDGKTLIAEYRTGRRMYSHGDVLFWDLASERSRRPVEAEPIGTRQFFFPDSCGRRYVISLDKGTVRLWEVEDKEVRIAEFTERGKKWIRAAFAPQVARLACLDEEGVLIVWNLETMEKICQFTHLHERFPDAEMATLEFSPDGKLLLSETDHRPSVRLWDVERGEEIREFPGDEIGGIMGLWDNRGFSPCGSYLACTEARTEELSYGGAICLWDVRRREILTTLPFRHASRFAYSPCGSYVACGGEDPKGILLWDLERCEIYRWLLLPTRCRETHALTFSSCGRYLAFGAAWERGFEKVPIHVWEVETGKHIVTFWGHPTDVQGLAFSPNNQLLASASFDGSILLWDLNPYL